MRLPILPNDFRPEYSPWFCIANIQVTYKAGKKMELYAGIKNLLNFKPKTPIMRPFDPFDKNINDPIANPNGYTSTPVIIMPRYRGVEEDLGLRYSL